MSIIDVLNSEPALGLVGSILGTIWTIFKSRDWYSNRRETRRVKALEALEAGVDETYQAYVRDIKKARGDGKLTPSEVRHALRSARKAAVEYGKSEGINVLKVVGKEYMDLWIEKFVNRRKRQ